jgi:hypothetical protein
MLPDEEIFEALGLKAITSGLPQPYEQALAYFLFGALQQFYLDGNRRTARYMMSGALNLGRRVAASP